ncbi:VOC family protein [Glycomyces algeriensis]|uniref:Glyoxalase n=1 Tax=Glycomyces algeriensis TaxID=256037 RepID=A0A9W6G681_9ACTN|nr:VOC family protein [Glycomyces algeriensis]MDA1367232.1 VOC family protein [Glycomyces algeriensis]MDR7353384.1 catechol 2,3-dioxygenase-like lactoylglutathione lyase family enzyme [Glycomyces algeriensis]GLI41079.1 glyoxalase [Glycomyces algeriensis]
MFKSISIHTVFVLDQEEAIDFYVGKLGFEIVEDADLGFMRWLTVSVPGDPEHRIHLEVPGPPSQSDETAAAVRDLLTKGALGATVLTTDDCRGTYKRLTDLGVEFTEEPVEQPYGIDCALRDPFGNHIRITQPAASEA